MSLKAFHVVFVSASTALSLGTGLWALRQTAGADGMLALGLIGIAGALALPVYGWWFLKKTKHLGYL